LLPNSVIIPRQTYISGTVNPEKAWRVFAIQTPIGAPVKNQALCPRTTALFKCVPNVIQGFFSILEPGKSIPAHCADDYDYLRYHLALRVPQDNPPSLRVKDQIHTWTEGGSILFDDSFDHEVFNESKEHRVVLIIDLLRPLPLPLHLLNVLFIRCLLPFISSAKATLVKL